MTEILPLVAGNWKMNGLKGSVLEIEALKQAAQAPDFTARTSVMICPPPTLLMAFAHILTDTPILLGGQDCHTEISGAHTGDISAEMLADAGAKAVIVGHSERRTDHDERDSDVYMKSLAAHRAGLTAIICVGETEYERKTGATLDVIARQLNGSVPSSATHDNTVIAYEPVWAIGTGLTPTTEDVAEAHQFIREQLSQIIGNEEALPMRILYGGSVKPSNAKELMSVSNVNGALVGGASLKVLDFIGIINAYKQ